MARLLQALFSKVAALSLFGKLAGQRIWRVITADRRLSITAAGLAAAVSLGFFSRHWWYRAFQRAILWIGTHHKTLDITLGVAVVVFIPFLLAAYAIHLSADATRSTKFKVWAIFTVGLLLGVLQQSLSVFEQEKKDIEVNTSGQVVRETLGAISTTLRTLTAAKPLTPAEQEKQRRQQILSLLSAQYVTERKEVDAEVISGTKEPPNQWINSQLKKMGENWTVPEEIGSAISAPKTLRMATGDEPFKNLTDSELADWTRDEVVKIAKMVSQSNAEAAQILPKITDPDQKRSMRETIEEKFAQEFFSCCQKDMAELRKELILRIGPRAKTEDEEAFWTILTTEVANQNPDKPPKIDPAWVGAYLPYLHSYELQLRHRSSAAPDRSTKFKWSVVLKQSGSAGFPTLNRYTVTAWPDKPIKSGFILIDYASAPLATYPTDPMNEVLQPGVNPQEDVDNADLMNYWKAHSKTALVLEVDNQPITPDHPLVLTVDHGSKPKINTMRVY